MFWCCCCICLFILIDTLVVSYVFVYNSLSDLLGRHLQQQWNFMSTQLWAHLPLFLFAKCSKPHTHCHSRDMSPMLCQIRRLGSTGDDWTKNDGSCVVDSLFFIKRSKAHMYRVCLWSLWLTRHGQWCCSIVIHVLAYLNIKKKQKQQHYYCCINFLFY